VLVVAMLCIRSWQRWQQQQGLAVALREEGAAEDDVLCGAGGAVQVSCDDLHVAMRCDVMFPLVRLPSG
jgi:hypothetical protein